MSVKSAKAFLEKVKDDEDFRKAVGEIASKEERMAFIKKAGFEFSKEELDEVQSDLGEDQLRAITGGSLRPPDCWGDFCTVDA